MVKAEEISRATGKDCVGWSLFMKLTFNPLPDDKF